MKTVLGERMYVLMLAVKGNVSEESGTLLVKELVEEIGMTVAPGDSISRYPVDGKGGVGYTFFQPLTESFIAFDAWPDFDGAYLFVCSCCEFDCREVYSIVEKHGLKSTQVASARLEMEGRGNGNIREDYKT